MPQSSATNERQIKAALDLAKNDALVEQTIIELIMRNPQGRRWMWNQLSFCRVFQGDSGVDFGTMAFEKGLRNYGLKLLNAVSGHTPALYVTMMQEQNPSAQLKEDPNGGHANDTDD